MKNNEKTTVSKEEILEWKKAHKEFNEHWIKEWKRYNFSIKEVKKWKDLGLNPYIYDKIREWRDNFGYDSTKEWINLGLHLNDYQAAAYWKN